MARIGRAGTLAAVMALTLPLSLSSCTPGPGPFAGDVRSGATALAPAVTPGATPPVPAPQPQSPPPAWTESAQPGSSAPQLPAQPLFTPYGSAAPAEAGSGTAPAAGARPGASAAMTPVPSPDPEPVAPPAASPAAASQATPQAGGRAVQAPDRPVSAYYVLLDDGGAKGVRFGCNDSLASVRRSAPGADDPLAAAMNALLDGSTGPAPGMYNALSASRLTLLSGTFDGYTATVYLSGALWPGGVCDVPRIEAQLTQTAVASVGATRADVFVNGVRLSDALSLK
jgi:Sporulation and spore germination